MTDYINRQGTLKAMDTWDKFGCDPNGKLVRYNDDEHYVPYVHYEDMVNVIKNMPPEDVPHWIPVSERMPEEDYCTGRGIQHSATVLVTVVNHGACDDTFVDMACTANGEWQLTYPQDDDPDIPKWCKIIAWMPLPEPYVEETDG